MYSSQTNISSTRNKYDLFCAEEIFWKKRTVLKFEVKNAFRKLTWLNIYFYPKTSWDEYAYKNLKEENAIERREERICYLWWKILIIRLELHEAVRCFCNTYIDFSLSSLQLEAWIRHFFSDVFHWIFCKLKDGKHRN